MRLLMVTPRYFPLMGGVETHVHEVARRLARRGVDVTVLTTNPAGELPSVEDVEGVMIRRVPAWPADRDYYFAPEIGRIVREEQWDLVHLQSYHTLVAPITMAAALRAHVPYVVTFHPGGHTSQLRNRLRGVQQLLLRPLLAGAERLIAVARFELEMFSRRLHLPCDKFVHIPNGCDIKAPGLASTAVHKNGTIASVGRLERYKGHQHVVAALPYVLQERPDTHLWIAGTGPYEPELRKLAADLGVEEKVEIRAVPPAEREQMARELAGASLVTLLSEYETHPIAALEALTLGCSLLVADTSGLRELADQGLARAIPLHSEPQAVATAMLEQLAHPIVPPPISLPTWDDCVDGLLKLYGETVPEAVLR
ncbi:MAG: glycosyltransferase family 4 protein [Caldilineaceae bacterium]